MLKKKLEYTFLAIITIFVLVLANNYYTSYSFKNNQIPQSYKQRITDKEQKILQLMGQNYGFIFKVPLIVTDKFKGRLYGLTSYKNGEITIYLNKKVMQESMDYIVDSVIAHEYAHALMFKLGHLHVEEGGHSKEWQQTCVKLGGVDCRQYVNQQEIIMSKMPFN